MARRAKGSIPEVGSSKITNLGSPRKAIATESFLFIPPDRAAARALRFSASCTSLSSWSISASAPWIPFSPAVSLMCSTTVSSGHSTLCCGHIPMDARTSLSCWGTAFPKMEISPLLGGNVPVIMLIVVVLPAPLCPSRQKHSPSTIVTLRSSTALISFPSASVNTLLSRVTLAHRSCRARACTAAGSSSMTTPPSSSPSGAVRVEVVAGGGTDLPQTSRQ
mmetsp:Transcript_114731/g.263356  ORF Transcript_114731/g.263356 Transcript_114731/m.263356 type:complete len:221 (-) Transcript_114731:1658-2320(-)